MSTPHAGAPQDRPAPQPAPGTAPEGTAPAQEKMPLMLRGAIWVAIGALIAAALVCVVWVLIGDQNGLIGKAFLTILLLAAFAGVALLDANLAARRPSWLVIASMATWVIALLVGAVKIWSPEHVDEYGYASYEPVERLWHLILTIGVLQLALLHQRLFWRAHARYVTTFTRAIALVTSALLGILVLLLVFYLAFPDAFDYPELYWRFVVALAILVAVGTTLIPLLNALFAPRPRPVAPHGVAGAGFVPPAAPVLQWPTYADGRTPLPVLPDGSPDWNAYYTGVPSVPQAPMAPHAAPPQAAPAPQGQPAPGPGSHAAPPAPPLPPQAPGYPEQPPTVQPPR
ncbi:hypothetical protein [Microbacterium lacusdiani]